MEPLHAYNPDVEPEAEAWLALDEQERIALAERFHRQLKISVPNTKAHAAFHAIVENQIALRLPSVVRAIQRLQAQGLSRHDAIHAIASVLADQLHEQAMAKTPVAVEAVQSRYDAAVERLSADAWRSKYGAGDA